jgi:hypothetical protein
MPFVSSGLTFGDFERLDKKMSFVHEKDKSFVKILDLDINEGPWLAGGAVLSWYNGEPVGDSDFDIFFKDIRQFDQMFGRLMRNHGSIVFTSDNALTLNITIDDDVKKVQLIRKNYYQSALDVINNFDFTICQLVTDGYDIVSGEKTFEHIKERRIVPFKEPSKAIVKRIIKYVSYGYKPDPDLISNIIENPDKYDWMFNNIDENYENAF